MATKVIKGKMYNTETAKMVASWDNGLSFTDYWYDDEDLFRKKTGEYFLWVRTLSSIFSFCDIYEPQTGIVPISEENAKEWAEKRLSGEEYIRLFGAVEE